MKPVKSRVAPLLLSSLFAMTLAVGATAQSYPVKTVRVIVPFTAGGGVDLTGRALAQHFTEAWGQPVVVENRAGAGGNIGADVIAKAAPDGYTIMITTTGHAVAPGLYRNLPFDPIKDFTPISQITQTYLVLVTHPSMPRSMKELIAHAKANPGKLNYGHPGVGVAPHLIGELLKSVAGIDFAMIAYKGDAQTVPAMMANEIQFEFTPPATIAQQVKAGKLRALAVSSLTRSRAFPDLPTTAEAGFPDVNYVGWNGFFAPGGTPRDIANKISAETIRALRSPQMVDRLTAGGTEPAGTTPDEFNAKYRADIAFYAKLIKDAKIPLVD
jgi:tripartite-type tricarboxylate transporter receptor subunit TctC